MSSSDETRQVLLDWMAALGTMGPRKAFEKYATEDLISHSPICVTGREAAIAYLEDEEDRGSTVTIHRMIADEDIVTMHMEMTFTDGSPTLAIVDIWRVENGKLAEMWDIPQPVPAATVSGNSMF